MKGYTVTWTPVAEATLTRLWLKASDPAAVQKASDALETEMKRSPNSLGMEISAGLRVAGSGPLLVLFRVSNPDRHVVVYAVKPKD